MQKTLGLLVVLALLSGCQQAYLDGAWSGTLECDNTRYDIDAAFDQSLETLEVTGQFFIEYQIDLGLLGRYRIWEKGEIEDGEYDVEDAAVSGRIDSLDAEGNNQAPDWLFDLELNERYDELAGELQRLDENDDVVATCDAELEPVANPGN